MSNFNFHSRVDLFLTEISIELLGNKIYDINGKRQDKLISLFKAVPQEREHDSVENSNDFLCSLGYQCDYTKRNSSTKALLDDQFNYILEDANSNANVNQEIMKSLRSYKEDQKLLSTEASLMNIEKLIGELIVQVDIENFSHFFSCRTVKSVGA